MGLHPHEVRKLHLKDFNLMLTGYQVRQDKEWNQTRHLMAFVLNYAGMGTTEFYTPQAIWPLSMDKENEKRMITTLQVAYKLYLEFL